MGFNELSLGKKIPIIVIIIIIIGAISYGVVSLLGLTVWDEIKVGWDSEYDALSLFGLTDSTTVNIDQGNYKLKIETDGDWTSYITTDNKFSQDGGTGPKTIDLGTVNSLSSITVDKMGSGDMKVSILDVNDNVVAERTNSMDYGTIYLLLKVKQS